MKTLAERFPRPDLVKRINLMADTVGGAAELISLDPTEMIEASIRITDLSDFGDSIDGDWRGRLEGLVASLEAEADLNVMGRLQVRQEILRCLQSRLFLKRRINEQPEILNEEILETIYEEVQEDFPNLSTKEWEDIATHRFTEGA